MHGQSNPDHRRKTLPPQQALVVFRLSPSFSRAVPMRCESGVLHGRAQQHQHAETHAPAPCCCPLCGLQEPSPRRGAGPAGARRRRSSRSSSARRWDGPRWGDRGGACVQGHAHAPAEAGGARGFDVPARRFSALIGAAAAAAAVRAAGAGVPGRTAGAHWTSSHGDELRQAAGGTELIMGLARSSFNTVSEHEAWG